MAIPNAALQKLLQEVETQALVSQQKIAQTQTEIQAKKRVARLNQLTSDELTSLSAGTRVYEGVGKMFVAVSPDTLTKRLDTEASALKKDIGDLEKKLHYQETTFKNSRDHIDKILQSGGRRSRERRRSSRYDPDDIETLPYHLRKQLDDAQRIKDAEAEKRRADAAELEKKKWESDYKDQEREEKRRRERILEEARQAEARERQEEKRRRERILEEARQAEARERQEEKRRRERILEEARQEEARKQKEADELRKKILEEEEEKKKKAQKKKEEEEREFEAKVREKFKAAGYSDERIDRVLHDKRKARDDSENAWALDLSKPTFIKVNRKYLMPDTLDYFNLPWEWDKKNTEYIVIKKYIDDDLQDVLFEHTRTLRLKEKKLLTSGYEKDVTIKLKPTTGVVKNKDQMYLVREKSKSPARLELKAADLELKAAGLELKAAGLELKAAGLELKAAGLELKAPSSQ
ncbi:hypothetical protein DV737_g922, partial [Chaetothyriales sp. CBS 132003]